MTPAGTRVTWFVLGVCVGVLLAVVGMAGIAAGAEPPQLPRATETAVEPVAANRSRIVVSEPSVGVSRFPTGKGGIPVIGTWAYANPSHGSGYLATPEPRGTSVRVCGPLGCLIRTTNDVGPDLYLQRAGRIGDLSSVLFQVICGPLGPGLCRGSYEVVPRIGMPETNTGALP